MSDPNDLRRQVHAQNNAWLLQLAGFFGGAILGFLFGVFVIMGMLMPGYGTGLLLAFVATIVGAWIGSRLAQDYSLR